MVIKHFKPEEIVQLVWDYNSVTNINNDNKGQHVMYDEVIQIEDQNSLTARTFGTINYYKNSEWYKQKEPESADEIVDIAESYSYFHGANIYLLDCDFDEIKGRKLIGKIHAKSRKRRIMECID